MTGLEHVVKTGLQVVALPNETDQGEDSWQPSLRKAAQRLGVPVESLTTAKFSDGDVLVSLEFEKILKPNAFKGLGLFNIHFSLLPKYRGCFTSFWPIMNGEDESGVTLHEIDEGIDTGRIIAQKKIALSREVTSRALYEKYQDAGLEIFAEHLQSLIQGNHISRDQQADFATYYSRNTFSRDNNELPVRATAWQIKNFVRAYFFPEYQTASFRGLAISECIITEARSTRKPGTVLFEDEKFLVVATADFDVELSKFRFSNANYPGAPYSVGSLSSKRSRPNLK